MAVLPRYVVLESDYNQKYLRYINDDVQRHGFLEFSGEEVVSPYTKHEVEMSKNFKGLVHIRCCYNNKYWVSWSPSQWWIVAGADEPSEDQSAWSCTLFEPISVGDNTIRLRHVKLGHYTSLSSASPPFGSCLFAGSATTMTHKNDVFKVIDLYSQVILPKNVAFKGDNGKYLSAQWIEGYQYLQFSSNDIGDSTVGNQVSTTRDGSIRIKSDFFNKFWRRSPNWIWADSSDNSNENPNTLFMPIKVDKNTVALRNMGNNNFCKRLTTEGKTSCLNAATPTITIQARLVVEELVLTREISNVDFHLLDARIYNQTPTTMATGTVKNYNESANTFNLKLSYTDSKAETWNYSVSLKLGVKTELKSGIPIIAEGKIEISTEFTGTYEWGSTLESSKTVEVSYEVIVPPKTKMTVSLLATTGSCDAPFSYTQTDTLLNGDTVTYTMDDGIYTGINSYNFKYESKEEKL